MPRVRLTIAPDQDREVDEGELLVLRGQGLVAEVLDEGAAPAPKDDPPQGGETPSAGDGETNPGSE